jgi:hypothetical protein
VTQIGYIYYPASDVDWNEVSEMDLGAMMDAAFLVTKGTLKIGEMSGTWELVDIANHSKLRSLINKVEDMKDMFRKTFDEALGPPVAPQDRHGTEVAPGIYYDPRNPFSP